MVHAVARLSLTMIWLYQGLVPKLLGPHPVERELSARMLPAVLPVDGTIQALGRGLEFPLLLSATANVREWYDDARDTYRIEVAVTNPIIGLVFQYTGSFGVEWIECETVPEDLRPVTATFGE